MIYLFSCSLRSSSVKVIGYYVLRLPHVFQCQLVGNGSKYFNVTLWMHIKQNL